MAGKEGQVNSATADLAEGLLRDGCRRYPVFLPFICSSMLTLCEVLKEKVAFFSHIYCQSSAMYTTSSLFISISRYLEQIDRIITQLDKDEMPINIYLDLSKAVDTIDHTILIDKLKYYGVHEINLKLFSAAT